MKVTILGKTWNLKFTPMGSNSNNIGHCDHPDTPNRCIKIKKTLKGKEQLDTILHELQHSAGHDIFDESFVAQFATDVAEVLWKLGWRRLSKEQRKILEIE